MTIEANPSESPAENEMETWLRGHPGRRVIVSVYSSAIDVRSAEPQPAPLWTVHLEVPQGDHVFSSSGSARSLAAAFAESKRALLRSVA